MKMELNTRLPNPFTKEEVDYLYKLVRQDHEEVCRTTSNEEQLEQQYLVMSKLIKISIARKIENKARIEQLIEEKRERREEEECQQKLEEQVNEGLKPYGMCVSDFKSEGCGT